MKITIERIIAAPVELVWHNWTTPEEIVCWNAASDDWHTTQATVDLRPGGQFSSRMEAKDGSIGFDFSGTYVRLVENQELVYALDDDRQVVVQFFVDSAGTRVRETFDAEAENEPELQRQGWQAILDNFAKHVEAQNQ